jgi:hypothetical protein
VKAHPAVAYYFVDDEPHDLCGNVRSAFQARNALIKSIDGAHPTFITENRTDAFDSLANTTDVLAAIGYPCHWGAACSLSNIADRIAALNAAGVNHYWSVPQLFEEPKKCGGYYRTESAAEYSTLMSQWRATTGSRVEGDFAFMWNRVYSCGVGLSEHPELWDAVAAWNR